MVVRHIGGGVHRRFGRSVNTYPSFNLPLADSGGTGAVDLTVAWGQGSATFTRATAAWTKLSTGLWISAGTGVARSTYTGMNTAIGAYAGYLAEGLRQNVCLQARAQTATVWVKTNMTAAKDQPGIDGVASSCCSITATAGNGTCFQTVVLASQAKAFSIFAKQITGTGAVGLTMDGGLTYTTVTPSINATTFSQVQITQTVATATVGIKIVTSGDKIAIDMAQLEDGVTFASTPIPTTTVAVTRNADVLTYPFAGNALAATGTSYAELFSEWTTTPIVATALSFGANPIGLFRVNNNVSTLTNNHDGTNGLDKAGLSDMSTASRKRASSWGGATKQITGDGVAVSSGAFDGDFGSVSISVGCDTSGVTQWFGGIKNVRIWTAQLSNQQLQAITT